MKCSSCDFENPDGFKFCGGCGQPLEQKPRLEAERRQITVMFCDLVGSTDLSAAIDAEELRELVRAYQAICAEVFERNHGHVAQYLGDGILAYFGYPVTYEDSTAKAVESALEIHQRLALWNETVPQNIEIRTGIHTGTVVVGEVGAGAHRENLAMGETPNLAARLQGVAKPGEVVVSSDTYALVSDRVEAESLGEKSLKGLPHPIEVFLVTQTTDPRARRRLARVRRSRVPAIGYQAERESLWQAWETACQGQGGCVALWGEAGMGKTRLMQTMKERVFGEDTYVVSLYPAPETQNTPLACVTEQLTYELPNAQAINEKCPGFESKALLEELLGFRDAEPIPGRQKFRLNALVDFWLQMSENRNLLVACDGADYLDPSSSELLRVLGSKLTGRRVLLFTTWRQEPGEEWGDSLQLTGLSHSELLTLVKLAAEEALTHTLRSDIATRAEGNPLFAEELSKNPHAGQASRLKDLLMARLDRFGESKPVLQRLSTAGRRFPEPILLALSKTVSDPVMEVVDHCLEERVLEKTKKSTEIAFSHGLFHNACYESLLRKNQQKFHSDLAEAILNHLPEWAHEVPEVLAYHLLRSEEPIEAVQYLATAGKKALRMSAEKEAAHHFEQALGLLPESPEYMGQRLELLLSLGTALIALRGYAHSQVRESFQKAREICSALGDPPPTFPALCGLWAFAFASGQLREAMSIATRLLELAQSAEEDSPRMLVAHAACGQTLCFKGELDKAREHLVQVCSQHKQEYHDSEAFSYFQTDPYVASNSYLGFLESLEGHTQASKQCAEVALRAARELKRSHTLAHTLFFDALISYENEDLPRFGQRVQDLAETATVYDFSLWLVLSGVFEALGQNDAPLFLERLGLLEKTGTKLGETWFVGHLYRLLKAAGQTGPAQAALEQCRAIAEERGEFFFVNSLTV
jgi:class 3 adenylate cyclase/tetratricopeptide (TPR) repeat protein